MLKNKIIVKKIRNIIILFMALIIMLGVYFNIKDSKAENVIQMTIEVADKAGVLSSETITVNATEKSDGTYMVELPTSINGNIVTKYYTSDGSEVSAEYGNAILQFTEEEIASLSTQVEIDYDTKEVAYNGEILIFYNKELKYNNDEVVIKGYMPFGTQLEVEDIDLTSLTAVTLPDANQTKRKVYDISLFEMVEVETVEEITDNETGSTATEQTEEGIENTEKENTETPEEQPTRTTTERVEYNPAIYCELINISIKYETEDVVTIYHLLEENNQLTQMNRWEGGKTYTIPTPLVSTYILATEPMEKTEDDTGISIGTPETTVGGTVTTAVGDIIQLYEDESIVVSCSTSSSHEGEELTEYSSEITINDAKRYEKVFIDMVGSLYVPNPNEGRVDWPPSGWGYAVYGDASTWETSPLTTQSVGEGTYTLEIDLTTISLPTNVLKIKIASVTKHGGVFIENDCYYATGHGTYTVKAGIRAQLGESELMSTSGETAATSGFLGNTNIQRQNIESVTFSQLTVEQLNSWTSLIDSAKNYWDVSEKGDKSIIAHRTDSDSDGAYEVTIGSPYVVVTGTDASYLFSYIGYSSSCNATAVINGMDNFDTRYATNMKHMFYACGFNAMTTLDLGDNFDTSNVTNMYQMFRECGQNKLTALNLGDNFNTSNVTTMYAMFYGTGKEMMTTLNLGGNFNTGKVTTMTSMFYECGYKKLSSLNLGSYFDTSAVTTMDHMFYACGHDSMTTLTLGSLFDTSAVTGMNQMFYQCGYTKLTSLNLGSLFDTTLVTNMNQMFYQCGFGAMTTLTLGSNFNTASATNMTEMFYQCGYTKMTSLNLGNNFDTNGVTGMSKMFYQCGYTAMTTLTLGSKIDASSATDLTQMFYQCGYTKMTSLSLGNNFSANSATSMSRMFYQCGYTAMTTLNLGTNFGGSSATDMTEMFYECGKMKMTTLTLGSNFDTSNATTMSKMFYQCGYTAMTSLSLGSKFDTSLITNMDYMFYGCGYTAMTTFSIGSAFDTSAVTSMISMFENFGRMKLTALDLGDLFNTGAVTDMTHMFKGCGYGAMTSFDIGGNFSTVNVTKMTTMFGDFGAGKLASFSLGSKFDTSSVTNMSGMFWNCGSGALTTFTLPDNFNTGAVTTMANMFNNFGTSKLTYLNLGARFNTSNVKDMTKMFYNCGTTAMVELDLGDSFVKIADTYTDFVTNVGKKWELIVWAPASIYVHAHQFKLSGSSTTKIDFFRGTINPTQDQPTLLSTASEDDRISPFLGNGNIQRQHVEKVTFQDTLAGFEKLMKEIEESKKTENPIKFEDVVWDASIDGDYSIVAWCKTTGRSMVIDTISYPTYNVYVATNGTILANEDSSNLFSYLGFSSASTETTVIENIAKLDTSKVKNMKAMFYFCGYTAMTSLDLGSSFDTSSATNMSEMFTGCGHNAMITLDLGDKFNTANVTNMSWMFARTGVAKMTGITFGSLFDTSKVTDMSYMFLECGITSMTSLVLPDTFNTSAVLDMYYMFWHCGYEAMTTLTLGSNFNTSNVTNMNGMFDSCGYAKMTALNLGSKFYTNKVTDMANMFRHCGYMKMSTLTLGSNFNTSNVKYMNGMFNDTGYTEMTSLDLGDLFYTTSATTMVGMFQNCGATKMTSLDLGPAFTNLASAHANMLTNTGKATCTIYIPEAIYYNKTTLKLSATSTTTLVPDATRNTINLKYKPEWTKVSTTVDTTNKKVTIVLKGAENTNYSSTVTSALTKDHITVYIDGETVTDVTKTLTATTSTSGVDYVQYNLVLSNFEKANTIPSGKTFKEWAGNIKLKIDGRGSATSTYSKNILKDQYGNQSMAQIDTSGTWTDVKLYDEDANGNGALDTGEDLDSDGVLDEHNLIENTTGRMFADFIKPAVVYRAANTTKDAANNKVTIQFDVTDKYYSSGTLAIGDLTIKVSGIDGDYLDLTGVTKELASSALTATVNGTSRTVGHRYTLTLTGLDRAVVASGKDYANYSGIIQIAIPANKITDTSGLKNAATTITSGIELPEAGSSDTPENIDIVNPIWELESTTINPTTKVATMVVKGTDKYLNTSTLTDRIELYVDGTQVTTATITPTLTETLTEDRSISYVVGTETITETQTGVKYGVRYTITISNFSLTGNQAKIKLLTGSLVDHSSNSNEVTEFMIYNALKSTSTETALTSGFLGNTAIQRQNIESVTFVSGVSAANSTKWDASAQGDNSILAWYTGSGPYQVYIGSTGAIFGNINSSYLFQGIGYASTCTATSVLNGLDKFFTMNVTNMKGMFKNCGYTAMTSLTLPSSFNTIKVTDMTDMFYNCGYTAMNSFDIGPNFNTASVTLMVNMFRAFGRTELESLSLGTQFNTGAVTNMNSMFRECGLKELDSLSLGTQFNTGAVTNMNSMFRECGRNKLGTLDLSSGTATSNTTQFNTSAVTDMAYMFANCGYGTDNGDDTYEGLTTLNLGNNFNTAAVTTMASMFQNTGYWKMTSLELGAKFDTSSVTSMNQMFRSAGQRQMVSLNLGTNFNTAKVTDMNQMFMYTGRYKLTSLDLGDKFYTTSATDMTGMLNCCGQYLMTSIDLGPAFTKIAETYTNIFSNTGKSGACTIYAPSAIYSTSTAFRLTSTSATTISYARGTINPRYRTQWLVNTTDVTVNTTNIDNSTIAITLKGQTLPTDGTYAYTSAVTSILTEDDITVYVDGEEVEATKSLAEASTSGNTLTQILTLSNFNKGRSGSNKYRDYSGKITLKMADGTLIDCYGSYLNGTTPVLNVAKDASGNVVGSTNLEETIYKDSGTMMANVDGATFADFIKPEVTYLSSETTIGNGNNGDTKILTVKFYISDKWINANNLTLANLGFKVDGTTVDITGSENSLTAETIDYGYQYTLVVKDLQQNPNNAWDFSGPATITIPAGKVSDLSGNTNDAKTITIGINETDGDHTTNETGTAQTVDVVDPIWEATAINKELDLRTVPSTNQMTGSMTATITLEGKDKYFNTDTLTAAQLKIYKGATEVTSSFTKNLSTATNITQTGYGLSGVVGHRYTLTVTGTVSLGDSYVVRVPADTLTDQYGNKNESIDIPLDFSSTTAGMLEMQEGSTSGADYAYNEWTKQDVYAYVNAISGRTITYTVDGGTAKGTGTGNATKLTGSVQPEIIVTTVEGTITTNVKYKIYIDQTKPTVPTYEAYHTPKSDNLPYDRTGWTDKEVWTDISSTDEHSGIQAIYYSTDKSTWTQFSFSKGALTQSGNTWTGTENWNLHQREDYYYLKAIDNVGNESVISADGSYDWNIKYDLTAPYWEAQNFDVDEANNKATVDLIGKDAHSGYGSDSLDGGDITVKINGTTVSAIQKGLTKVSSTVGGEVKYTLTLTNFEEAARQSGKSYKEWSGAITIDVAANTLMDNAGGQTDNVGNYNTAQTLTLGHADVIEPEFTYKSSDTTLSTANKTVTVLFDVVDKYFSSSSLANTDITVKLIDENVTIPNANITKTLTLKTISSETTSGNLTYKTNGDIYADVNGDGTKEKIGQRYQLVIGGLEQKTDGYSDGYTYSGPMSLTFASGKIKDTSNNSNNSWTITLGVNEDDGNDSTDETGSQQIIDVVDPIWSIDGTPSITTTSGITTANVTLKVEDKYFSDSTLTRDQIQVLIDGENKTSNIDRTLTGPTDTTSTGEKYTFSMTNFEESYDEFLAQRALYAADSSTGRLYREFTGPVQVQIPKGAAVDVTGNDSELITLDVGTIDTLKPEVVKVSSSVNTSAKTQTIVFDITDKYLASSAITTSDTSKIHVYVDGEETTDVTKTVSIQTLTATINGTSKTIGYRYTLVLSNFEKARTSVNETREFKDWSGTVFIKIDADTAKDTAGTGNAETTLNMNTTHIDTGASVSDFVDFIKPDVIYKYTDSAQAAPGDINYEGKTFTMVFDIIDKYYTGSTLTINDLIIKIDGEEPDWREAGETTGVSKNLTSTDIKNTFKKTVGGSITNAEYTIGKRYTLVLSNLEQIQIASGDQYLDYSGVITVVVPAGVVTDNGPKNDGANKNSNVATTITSGIDIPGGSTSDAEIVDVVDPLIQKVESSANAVSKTATIKLKATDKYYDSANSSITGKIQVLVNGTVTTSGVTVTPGTATPIYKTGTTDVQVGIEQTVTIAYTGFSSSTNQVAIRILEDAIKDTSGNGNLQTDFIVYNVLKATSSETAATSKFLGITGIERQNIENVKFVTLTKDQMETWANAIATDTTYQDVSARGDKTIVAHYKDTNSNGAYEIEIGSCWEIFANQNSSYLFSYIGYATTCTVIDAVTSLNLLNTNSVTNMACMFQNFGYNAMTTLTLPTSFDTSNVTSMFAMFRRCGYKAMISLTLPTTFNTSSVTDMGDIFRGCGYIAMTSLILPESFDTSSVTGMSNMFYDCGYTAMTSLILPESFNTSSVTGSMNSMFRACGYTAMTSLTLPAAFDTNNVTSMKNMFMDCGYTAMTSLTLPEVFDTSSVTDMSQMFYKCGYTAMTSLTLPEAFDTSSVTDMSSMFSLCGRTAMTSLTLPAAFDTSSVTDMSSMFNYCGETAMTSLTLPEAFDTSSVTDMSSMFSYCGATAMTILTLPAAFDTSSVTNMDSMFRECGYTAMTSLTLPAAFDTSSVTNMSKMFYSCGYEVMTSLDLGDNFYTTAVTDMTLMFRETGFKAMTVLDLGPAFTKIADTNTNMFMNIGKSECKIYAPESIYKTKNAFKLSTTDTTNSISYTRGTINPIYKPEWEVTGSTVNTSNKTIEVTVKGSAYKNQTINSNVAIKYADNVTSTLSTGEVNVFLGETDITSYVTATVGTGSTTTETVTVGAESKTINVVTHVITISNLDDVVRLTGIPYNEWSGRISLKVAGRGEATSTYGANVLKDSTYGNQNMMEIDTTGTWENITTGNEYVDFIKPEVRYESTNTQIVGLPDSADATDAEKQVIVLFDVLDKYFSGSTLAASDITLKVISPTPEVTADPTKFTKTLTIKTIDTETTNATSGLTYKTNGDIYFDIDGDGTKEKVGQRYELVISDLDQGDGTSYSGPMSITYPAGKVTDTSNNSNVATTITIGIDETDGNLSTGDGGSQQIVDLVNPLWSVEGTPSVTTTSGVTSANITLNITDKYFADSTLTKEQIQVLVDGENKASELDITLTGPTSTTATGEKYTFSMTNFEETFAEYLAQRAAYKANPSTGRLYREFSGPVQIVIPKGTAVDQYGNDSEQFTVNLGTIDTLKPEVIKVSSAVNTSAKTQTIVFDITDKYLASSAITTTDTSKIHVLVDGEETTDVTKTVSIQTLEATINGTLKTIGYRYTLVLSNFEKSRTSVNATRAFKDWSGSVSIQIEANTAKDSSNIGNAATTLDMNTTNIDTGATVSDFVDYIKPEVIYKYTESAQGNPGDINYEGKTFTMVFDIIDKYYTGSTLTINDLIIKIDGEVPDWRETGETTGVTKNLTSTDIKNTFKKTVGGTVTNAEYTIGKRYTLVLSNLEQIQIASGDQYLDYSGVITVVVPAGKVTDNGPKNDGANKNSNVQTTITSGIDIPGGSTSDSEIVDVVDPLIQKVTTSANAVDRTATISLKATDKYYDATNSSLTGKIQVLVNGTVTTSGITITPGTASPIYKTGTTDVQVGIEQTITISGFSSSANQVAVRILADAIKDTSGNGNLQTDLIVYNVLKSTTSERAATSAFLGSTDTAIQRQNIESVKFTQLTELEMKTWANSIATDTKYWDASAQRDKSIVAHATDANSNGAYEVEIGSHWEIFANKYSSYLFSYIGYSSSCAATTAVTSLNLLNTNSVTDMAYMFQYFGHNAMTTLTLPTTFNTTNVTYMDYMFSNCGYTAMTSLTLPATFDTSSVTEMDYMFSKCGYTAMTSLTLPATFDTSSVTNMNSMFKECGYTAMTSLTLPEAFDTSSVTNMWAMFFSCGYTAMTSLTLPSSFNTSSVTDMGAMFNRCGYTAMTSLTLPEAFDTSSVTTMSAMFYKCGYTAMTSLTLPEAFDTSSVTNMSSMFHSCGGNAMTSLTLPEAFDTSSVTNMNNMFYWCGYAAMTSLTLPEAFDTSSVTNMNNMFEYCGYTAMTSLDLGNNFYTIASTDMTNMFHDTGNRAMTVLDLGPAFTKIADTNTSIFTNTGKSGCVIYASESIYKSKNAFKLSTTDTTSTTSTVPYTTGTINPIYKPEWEVTGSTVNTSNKTIAITVKGSAYKNQTINPNVTIKYADNVISTLAKEDIAVFLGETDITSYIDAVVGTGTTSTNATSGKTEVTHVITISDFDEAVRVTGIPYNEWAGNISLKIAGRGEATSTYSANVLKDATYGNQNMMEIDSTGTWVDVKDGNEFVDLVKPEIRYESANTTIGSGPTGDQKVKVIFDILDKYFASSTIIANKANITITMLDVTQSGTAVNTTVTKEVTVKTIDAEVTDATSGLTYRTNGDIYFDTNGDGVKEKVGVRYELVMGNLDQGAGWDYSGPMSITFPAGIATDGSSNTNNAKTITIGIDDKDGSDDLYVTEPYLPDGYRYVEGTRLDNGLVIEEGSGNQYVWIEVPKTSTVYGTAGLNITEFTDAEITKIENDLKTYTNTYRNGTTCKDEFETDAQVLAATGLADKEEYYELKKNALMSIYKNGGFYIGRYEAGSDTNRTSHTAIADTLVPASKQNQYPLIYVTNSEAQTLASKVLTTDDYTSSLMFGVQWDLVLRYLQSKGATTNELNVDSVNWGNYTNSTFTFNRGKYAQHENFSTWYDYTTDLTGIVESKVKKTAASTANSILYTTGASDSNSKQNIYDLAGNTREWTLEFSSTSAPTVMRGGSYYNGGTMAASYRRALGTDYSSSYNGFRVAIFKNEEPEIVDVVKPKWELVTSDTDSGVVKLRAIDKYFNRTTFSENDVPIYVNGVESENVEVTVGDATYIKLDESGNYVATTEGDEDIIGVEYTIQLDNITLEEPEYIEFTPTEAIVGGTAKYRKENGGDINVRIDAGAIEDKSGNLNDEQDFYIGMIDSTKPEIYEVQKTQNASTKTQTIIFNVTDRNWYTPTDAEKALGITNEITLDEIATWLDGIETTNITKYDLDYVEIKAEIDNTVKSLGHQYTLVLTETVETQEELITSGREYRELSGTVDVKVLETAATDLNGNPINSDTTTISDFVDFIKPEITYRYTESAQAAPGDINYEGKTFTMVFDILDKYYSGSTLTSADQLVIKIDGEVPDWTKVGRNLTATDIYAQTAFNKTVGGSIVNGAHKIGQRYTLVLSNLEQLEILSGDQFADYSGVISVVVPSSVTVKVTDTSNNSNNEKTITSGIDIFADLESSDPSQIVDVVDPIWVRVSSSANAINQTATITVRGTDKYYTSSDLASFLKVYVDGTDVTSSVTVNVSTATAVNKTGTTTQVGDEYTVTLTGFAQNADQVKIRILEGAMTDQSGNTNKDTDLIAYNCLTLTSYEIGATSQFLGIEGIEREDIENVKFLSSTAGKPATTFDVSAQQDGSIIAWYEDSNSNGAYEVKIASNYEIFANQNSSYLFANIGSSNLCTATEAVTNLSLLNTNSVTNMSDMFWFFGYRAMTSLNLGAFDTTNVTNMREMFNGCGYTAMTSLNLGSAFNTTKVTDMSWMFTNTGYTAMTTMNVGASFNTTNVTDMSYMFMATGYTKMTNIYFGTESGTSGVITLPDNFNTAKVTDMSYMFKYFGYTKMTQLQLGNSFNTALVTNMESMFDSTGYTAMTTINLGANFYTAAVTNMSSMFNSCGYTAMTALDLGNNFDTTLVQNMSKMFQNCGYTKLTNLDLKDKFKTTNVTDMSYMFNNCGATLMTVLDLGPLFTQIPNTASAYADMFTGCGNSSIIIYAPETIYLDRETFKMNKLGT